MELAYYIYRILRSQLMVMFSWGFSHPVVIRNGLRFSVNGFKHKGDVAVELSPMDEFRISLIKHGKVVRVIDGVYIDNLVQVIDEAVERVHDYEQRVREEYSLSHARAL